MMKHTAMKNYIVSFSAAIIVVIVLMVLVRFSLLANVLLAPGMLLATHIVAHSTWDGLHISDTGEVDPVAKVSPWLYLYTALVVILNAIIVTLPILFLVRRLRRRDSM